tara:strand:- start:632 stop:1585 length:954 start_codon:yes stop_codon:yes gene_type:complete
MAPPRIKSKKIKIPKLNLKLDDDSKVGKKKEVLEDDPKVGKKKKKKETKKAETRAREFVSAAQRRKKARQAEEFVSAAEKAKEKRKKDETRAGEFVSAAERRKKVKSKKVKSKKAKSSSDSYTIRSGDTLTSIAKANNTTIKKLVELNSIKDPNKIYIGRKLKLPTDEYAFEDKKNVQGKDRELVKPKLYRPRKKDPVMDDDEFFDKNTMTRRKSKPHPMKKSQERKQEKPRFRFAGKEGTMLGDLSRKLGIKFDYNAKAGDALAGGGMVGASDMSARRMTSSPAKKKKTPQYYRGGGSIKQGKKYAYGGRVAKYKG